MRVKCDYCGKNAELVTGAKIYPHRPDLHGKMFWYCANGHSPAYVGCHGNSKNNAPLGRLADSLLRKLKGQAHEAFDWLWKENHMSRKDAYSWLAEKMDIPMAACHIGKFSPDQCRQCIDICLREVRHDKR